MKCPNKKLCLKCYKMHIYSVMSAVWVVVDRRWKQRFWELDVILASFDISQIAAKISKLFKNGMLRNAYGRQQKHFVSAKSRILKLSFCRRNTWTVKVSAKYTEIQPPEKCVGFVTYLIETGRSTDVGNTSQFSLLFLCSFAK